MAIITLATGTNPRSSIGTSIITVGAQGSAIAQPATNNRSRPSGTPNGNGVSTTSGFSQLDQLIRSLDAQFDTLPNQSAWNTLASASADLWQLCANCTPAASGKKLFRQVNFNRFVLGLGNITDPSSLGAPPAVAAGAADIELNNPAIPGLSTLVDLLLPSPPCVYFAQIGQQMANPSWVLDATQLGVIQTDGTSWEWLKAIVTILWPSAPVGSYYAQVNLCTCSPSGMPGLTAPLSVVYLVWA